MDCLLGTTKGEANTTIEGSGTTFAASARSDPHGRCRSFNQVTQADILVANETGKAHAVRLARRFVARLTLRYFPCLHWRQPLPNIVVKSWYAAQASSKG